MENLKKYEFRPLCSTDLFLMFNILTKIGFKEVKDCFNGDAVKAIAGKSKDKEDAAINVGIDIMLNIGGIIIGNASKCENDIYSLLSAVSNLSPADVKKLSLSEFAEMIVDFVKKPDFIDFFKVVSKLFK